MRMIEYEFSRRDFSNDEIEDINNLLVLLTGKPDTIILSDLIDVAENSKLLLGRIGVEGKVVGMATLAVINIPSGKYGRIEDVVVQKEYRRQGIGKELTQRLIEEARRLGLARINLSSNPKRVEANHLYQGLGFSKVETNLYTLDLG